MIRRLATGLTLLALLHCTAMANPAVSGDTLDAGLLDDTRLSGSSAASSATEPVTTVRVVPPAATPARPLSANPLWGIPLTKLSGTRERPIFSPSRRPPPPAAVAEPVAAKAPPPRKKTVEPPPLSLVGTISGDDEGFGIFLDPSTKAALRLKIGDDYQGWKLRTIQGREVTMEKDEQAAVLTLPQPGTEAGGEVRLIPVSAVKTPVAAGR
jgi:general secretion pathway protein N